MTADAALRLIMSGGLVDAGAPGPPAPVPSGS
jgi:hypothetical protein